MGMRELSSAYIIAVVIAIPPATMKLMKRLGPAYCAAMPVKAKMPAPMVLPRPKII